MKENPSVFFHPSSFIPHPFLRIPSYESFLTDPADFVSRLRCLRWQQKRAMFFIEAPRKGEWGARTPDECQPLVHNERVSGGARPPLAKAFAVPEATVECTMAVRIENM